MVGATETNVEMGYKNSARQINSCSSHTITLLHGETNATAAKKKSTSAPSGSGGCLNRSGEPEAVAEAEDDGQGQRLRHEPWK